MMMRLRTIELLFPTETGREVRFLDELLVFLSGIPAATRHQQSLTFSPQYPHRAWPLTTIGGSSRAEVQLNFLHYRRKKIALHDAPIRRILRPIDRRPMPEKKDESIDLEQLIDLLGDQLVAFDHVGLNIPAARVSQSEYEKCINSLGNVCTLHHYPTGEDWDFILPSTRSEWTHGITEFKSGREPRWEFVFDDYTEIPIVQMCIETKLAKKRLCELLPDPVGISYEGLPFRTVFLQAPWRNLGIRCDFQAYSSNRQNSWITGEWLATRGRRLGDFD